jgi:CBS domain-containing protein
MKVSDILNTKGRNVFHVNESITVYDALRVMGEKNIGALLVMDGEELRGIISERDYARKIVLMGKKSSDTLVKDIMTEKVLSVAPDDSIEKCMEMMSEKHIRHLPVLNADQVVGVISITDVVTAIIASQKETINHLQNYISQ